MRYFIDTEFIERGRMFPLVLISIGIVCEDGREYYAIASDWREEWASDWVKENVISHLEKDVRRISPVFIADDIRDFCNPEVYGNPEFWGYYADYDWVVFAQLFGTMMDLPKGFPMYCRDIKQLCDEKGNPKLPEQGKREHNALSDARWNKVAWEYLHQ